MKSMGLYSTNQGMLKERRFIPTWHVLRREHATLWKCWLTISCDSHSKTKNCPITDTLFKTGEARLIPSFQRGC